MKTQNKQMPKNLSDYAAPEVVIYAFETAGAILGLSPGNGDSGGINPDPGPWN